MKASDSNESTIVTTRLFTSGSGLFPSLSALISKFVQHFDLINFHPGHSGQFTQL